MLAAQSGQKRLPKAVCELGPGSSQGVGIAAILCGADSYTSVDVVDYDVRQNNLAVMDELVELFRKREEIPGPDEFPALYPQLDDYSFPAHLLDDRLDDRSGCLADHRLDSIRGALEDAVGMNDGITIQHQTVRPGEAVLDACSVDMILSQAVLVYAPDLESEYRWMSRILKPGGIMSHQLDYSVKLSFPDVKHWNSHWTCSDWRWSIIRRNRTVIVNRQPHSVHLQWMERFGCEVVCNKVMRKDSGLTRESLAKNFPGTADDLTARAAFVIARKRSAS